jgi:cysteine desulfurase
LINPTEHPAVLEAARCHFGEQRLTWLPLSRDGVVTWSVVEQAIREAGWLGGEEPRGAVVVMAANNETGVLQPWPEIARLCQSLAIPYVCDASQWLGKLSASGFGQVAWAFGAAHKFGGPKGVGFLQRPKEEESFVIRRGGGQEGGQRAGTENLASIAAMVAALVEAEQSKVLRESERQQWRDVFERDLQLALPGVAIIGAGAERLWNTAALRMPHGENHRWVAQLDKLGFEVAIGSACATGKSSGSHVLPAMGYSVEDARRVLRVSAGWKTTPGDWQALMEALVKVAPVLKTDASVVSV